MSEKHFITTLSSSVKLPINKTREQITNKNDLFSVQPSQYFINLQYYPQDTGSLFRIITLTAVPIQKYHRLL